MNIRYEIAKTMYAALGVDTDAAIEKLKTIPIALHCWQGDDVSGFVVQRADFSGLVVIVADEIDFLVFALLFGALFCHKAKSSVCGSLVEHKRVRPHICEFIMDCIDVHHHFSSPFA